MNDKVIESSVQIAISNAILAVLVRRGLVSNDEADRTMRIFTQELDNTEAKNVA